MRHALRGELEKRNKKLLLTPLLSFTRGWKVSRPCLMEIQISSTLHSQQAKSSSLLHTGRQPNGDGSRSRNDRHGHGKWRGSPTIIKSCAGHYDVGHTGNYTVQFPLNAILESLSHQHDAICSEFWVYLWLLAQEIGRASCRERV